MISNKQVLHETAPTKHRTIREVNRPDVEKIKGKTTIAEPIIVLVMLKIVLMDEFFFVTKLFLTSWIRLLLVKGSTVESLTLLIANFSLYSSLSILSNYLIFS